MITVQANGAAMPALGFGTWELRGSTAEALVEAALGLGYRHIDTAEMYGNETEVGRGLKASGLARDDYFLTTKIWPDHFRKDELRRAADACLARLGVDQVDLLLLHWPSKSVPLAETMEALVAVHAAGQARHIGVSNFTIAMVEEAQRLSPVPLVCNQVEYHPFLRQQRLLQSLAQHGMALTAYCPLARGRVVQDPLLRRIGEAHGRSASQVALRWLVQQPNVVAIPRSAKIEHAKSNLAIMDFSLSEDEMAQIHGLARADGRIVNGSQAPRWDQD